MGGGEEGTTSFSARKHASLSLSLSLSLYTWSKNSSYIYYQIGQEKFKQTQTYYFSLTMGSCILMVALVR